VKGGGAGGRQGWIFPCGGPEAKGPRPQPRDAPRAPPPAPQSELQAAVGPSGPPAAALIRAADREGKGAINRAEFDAVMRTHFGTA
jgi:hypothetical protein